MDFGVPLLQFVRQPDGSSQCHEIPEDGFAGQPARFFQCTRVLSQGLKDPVDSLGDVGQDTAVALDVQSGSASLKIFLPTGDDLSTSVTCTGMPSNPVSSRSSWSRAPKYAKP